VISWTRSKKVKGHSGEKGVKRKKERLGKKPHTWKFGPEKRTHHYKLSSNSSGNAVVEKEI